MWKSSDIRRHHLEFTRIRSHCDDEYMAPYLDQMISDPDRYRVLELRNNVLTDVSGLKIAKIIETSQKIKEVYLCNNRFTKKTYIAIARALHTNTSLEVIYLYGNSITEDDKDEIRQHFIAALRCKSRQVSPYPFWRLFEPNGADYRSLLRVAESLGDPTMQ